ncbi:MAG: hypothetical protein PWQ96_2419 [Clostridia bacterium]|nr:hypothetical protein [Clostridia bacterium]
MKNKKFFKVCMLVLVLVFVLSSATFATDGMKSIKVLYKNIKIKINGSYKTADHEPFVINGATYVPLRFIAEALGGSVDWNAATNTVSINQEAADSQVLEQLRKELVEKENELVILRAQMEAMQEDLLKKNEIKDLEDRLNKRYDELDNVEIDDITLDGDRYKTEVLVEVDLEDSNLEAWADLKDRDIENWVEDLVQDIQEEFDKDTEITGRIFDTEEDVTIVEFEKDGRRRLDVEFDDKDYRNHEEDVNQVERDLRGRVWDIDGYDFKVAYVDYDIDRDKIEVQMTDHSGELIREDDWENFDRDDIERDVEDICYYIADEFEDEAGVQPERVYLEIYDEDWKLLDEFEYDVDDRELE